MYYVGAFLAIYGSYALLTDFFAWFKNFRKERKDAKRFKALVEAFADGTYRPWNGAPEGLDLPPNPSNPWNDVPEVPTLGVEGVSLRDWIDKGTPPPEDRLP